MAVGDIQPHDLPRILWRESRVALLCGGTLAVCGQLAVDGLAQVEFADDGGGGQVEQDVYKRQDA